MTTNAPRRQFAAYGSVLTMAAVLLLGGCQVSTHSPSDDETNPQEGLSAALTPTAGGTQSGNDSKASTEQYTDLWQKIAASDAIALPDHKEIDYFLKLHSSRMLFTKAAPGAAEPWLYDIVTRLEQRNMPLELALLPIVESAYNPASRGAGVAGLWQLASQTGRNFKLRVNKSFDGRLDHIASTEATLDYLQHLHDMFGNDWISAVAAYNIGEGNFGNAVERSRRKGKATDFYSLGLSRKQVPTVYKWLALVDIVRDPKALAQSFPPIDNRQVLARELAPNGVSLKQIAAKSGIAEKELKKLNPAFRTGAVPTKGEYWINLPLDAADSFANAKGSMTADAKNVEVKDDDGEKPRRYVVKSGDTLGGIAKRNGVKLQALLSANGLKKDSVIRPGQTLKLP
ncbi:transglycosylase SLT domain-containing protein [Shewanella sp. JM162201]|uniref:Transglycosylase SLT domain-containing protein n=1 Tax=Shewanella jiangmenensis TaxID=2837387 RepID=A0ABS5V2X8_9GAMM|nr:transglycosylase SLT domain-containing protein [Shewanella jiangmenensis]MBT1444809.1 transglycosylase SLT domain-containing protein [Shewanella jiangmenensis]